MIMISYQDFSGEPWDKSVVPPNKVLPILLGSDKVLSVETIKNTFGYTTTRVWIISEIDER